MLDSGQIAPVLLLTGGQEGESLAWAKEFAGKVMGSPHEKKIASGHHPDLHFYQIEGKSGTHSLLSMQQLVKEVFMPPFEAGVSLFVIEEAHRMLPSSSNCLLKTLEEPPNHCFIILLTSRPELLLPTIISRCRPVVLPSLPLAASKEVEGFVEGLLKAESEADYPSLLRQAALVEEWILEEEIGAPSYYQKVELFFEEVARHVQHHSWKNKRFSEKKLLELMEESQLALERNMKLRTIVINIFLSL